MVKNMENERETIFYGDNYQHCDPRFLVTVV